MIRGLSVQLQLTLQEYSCLVEAIVQTEGDRLHVWGMGDGAEGSAGNRQFIDELNADHARGALHPTEFTRSTLSIHIYDSVVVFEKGRHTAKHAPQIGNHFLA